MAATGETKAIGIVAPNTRMVALEIRDDVPAGTPGEGMVRDQLLPDRQEQGELQHVDHGDGQCVEGHGQRAGGIFGKHRGGEGDQGDDPESCEREALGQRVHPLDHVQDPPVVSPETGQNGEAQSIGTELGQPITHSPAEAVDTQSGRYMDVKDQQGHRDGKDPVGQCDQPIRALLFRSDSAHTTQSGRARARGLGLSRLRASPATPARPAVPPNGPAAVMRPGGRRDRAGTTARARPHSAVRLRAVAGPGSLEAACTRGATDTSEENPWPSSRLRSKSTAPSPRSSPFSRTARTTGSSARVYRTSPSPRPGRRRWGPCSAAR